MTLNDLSLVEEGDEGLVGALNEHELQRVAIESNALEGANDGAESGTAGNYEKIINE